MPRVTGVIHPAVYVKQARNAAMLLILALFAASCGASRADQSVPVLNAATKQPTVTARDLEQRIHDNINRVRAKQGLSSLVLNKELSVIARKHSADMAARNYFDHQSPDGRGFQDRYRQAGFSCAIRSGNTIWQGAENILQNNLFDRVVIVNGVSRYDWNTAGEIAESTVEGWMKSPGHRRNILTPVWKTEGIGVVITPGGKVYVTQNFC